MKKVAIVGNAPINPSLHKIINQHDCVIRFGNPSLDQIGENPRTDILFIANSKKQTKATLTNNLYLNGPVFGQAKKIILPYHQTIIAKFMPKPNLISAIKGAKADLTGLCIQAATVADKPYQILTIEAYLETCTKLGYSKKDLRKKFPSSGIMAIHYITTDPDCDALIDIYGFSFEGWKRHDWLAERKYVNALIELGLARIFHEKPASSY